MGATGGGGGGLHGGERPGDLRGAGCREGVVLCAHGGVSLHAQEAEAAGCTAVSGLEMFVGQDAGSLLSHVLKEGLLHGQEAEAAGCTVVSGLEMFVGQAVEQYELFTRQAAPVTVMRQAVMESLATH